MGVLSFWTLEKVRTMSCKVLDLSELEKSFYKSSEIVELKELAVLPEPKKRIKIRECGDLRYWWDDNSASTYDRLGNAG
jgi:hypothetical protein